MSEFPERYESVCCTSGKSPEQEWAELDKTEARPHRFTDLREMWRKALNRLHAYDMSERLGRKGGER